ncbi:glycosyltransferase family 25 protein [Aeromonas veronii]|uniref:glycosyltransferase family 25 protein n=1 Tax=Aeromonas veronii TaxID=654 RepID=UPI00039EE60C|nr:glycosyltransferase family 25 protein [Aeromonas veronii]MBE8736251.1 glycosyltransferase family 25 protein [Aeromonas veronii]MBE8738688.1 glycosyltransferase family 25 protein [Aeromonas veronii]MBE8744950.1 glycosyltransferase family 25 protein [Aeromonas veronii]MBE8766283.1 glycosyltransferase family 25 protein [Aeromonas veronii]MBE8840310.1 glycosyltransferase family 25 protein [Aeromonas veronii]
MIPVFIISLTRSADRRAMVERQMSHLGIDFEFFDAVDGKSLPSDRLAKVDFNLARETCGHDLSLGEVGCAMSHINIYEVMVERNIPRCVILEDDIYVHMHFKAIVNEVINKNSSDIVFLHHGKAKHLPIYSSLPEGYRLAKYLTPSKNSQRGIISTGGYILTLAGAHKLLKIAYPIRMPADYLTGRLQWNKLSAAGVEPCCLDVGLFQSTIDDRNYGQHIE